MDISGKSTGGGLRARPSASAKKRASRACMVVTTGAPRTRNGTAMKRGVVKAIVRLESELQKRVVHDPVLARPQARQHMRQAHVIVERDWRREPDLRGVEHAQVRFSEEGSLLVVRLPFRE